MNKTQTSEVELTNEKTNLRQAETAAGQAETAAGQAETAVGQTGTSTGLDKTTDSAAASTDHTPARPAPEKKRMDKLVGIISDIFVPTLPVITAAGILKALTLLLAALGLLSETSDTYYVLSFVSNAGFYFLPLLLAHSTAKRFDGNPYLAVFLTAMLLHPDFLNLVKDGSSLSFLTLSVPMISYSSTVVPAILVGLASAFLERFLRKWVPDIISFFAVPLLLTLIMAPLILFVLGPVGMLIGNGLSGALDFIHNRIGWPAIALMAALVPLIVTGGFSLCFLPLALASINATGFDPFTRPAFLAANISMGASALAVALKSRRRENRSLGIQTSVVALMGITEPSIYGVLLPLKRPFLASMIASGIGGAFAGITGVRSMAYASPSLITLPIFLGDRFVYTLITVAITFVCSFVLTWIIGFEDKELHGTTNK